jgi:MFS family permease
MALAAAAPLPGSFWRLWSSQTLSNLGDGIRLAAFPLLAVTLTQDPRLVAGVAVVQYIPWLLLGLPAGAVVDRVDRRRLMAAVSAGRTAALTLLVAALATDVAVLPMLYVTAFLVGVGETLYDTAAHAAVPQLVAQSQLVRANGRFVSSMVVTDEFVGPLLGAALFTISVLLPFGVHASLVLVAAALVLTLPRLTPGPTSPDPPTPQRTGNLLGGPPGGASDGAANGGPDGAPDRGLRGALASVRWLWAQPALRVMLLLSVVLVAADSAWFGLLVLYTTQVLDLPAATYGILVAVGALGGLLGAAATERVTRRFGRGPVFVASVFIAALTQIVLGLTASTTLATVLLALSSAAFAAYNVIGASLRQILVPSHLLGRVTGAYRTCTMSAAALGAAGGGLAAAAMGIRAPFLVGGAVLFIALALSLRMTPLAKIMD